MKYYSIFILFFVLIVSCKQRQQPVVTPWGETITMEQDDDADADSLAAFDLDQIVHAGELIALTISGPTTCYDYRGTRLGLHAMLCQRLADTLGIRLRLEICRDTTELMARLQSGDGDLVAYPLLTNDSLGWLIPTEKPLLQEAVHQWFSPSLLSLVQKEEQQLLRSGGGVKRHVYAPMLNSNEGIISRYDALFQRYCQPIRWDWRLMAAQCYQESTFDPNALSFAGARGLMQIMPQTADHLQLPRSQLNNPEQNIAQTKNHGLCAAGGYRRRLSLGHPEKRIWRRTRYSAHDSGGNDLCRLHPDNGKGNQKRRSDFNRNDPARYNGCAQSDDLSRNGRFWLSADGETVDHDADSRDAVQLFWLCLSAGGPEICTCRDGSCFHGCESSDCEYHGSCVCRRSGHRAEACGLCSDSCGIAPVQYERRRKAKAAAYCIAHILANNNNQPSRRNFARD